MAEPEEDKVLERYRALGRDEPPPELDARILDAARRAAAVRPVRRRWVLPASIAAVVVLSVSVALKVERERAAPAPAAPSASDNLMRAPTLERKLQETPAGSAAQAGRLSPKSAEASPERWLARIAALRRAGDDDEADRQLAEFRRRFPEYRIPEAMRRKVEPR